MRKLFSTLLNEATGHGRRLATYLVVMMSAVLCGLVGVGFLTAGAYLWLAPRYGAMESALGIGAFFIVVAAIIVFAANAKQDRQQGAAAPAPAAAPKPEVPIPPAVNTLLQALQENGRDNERLALLATTEAIKNASPLQLVVTSLVAGYVGGQMIKQVLTKPKSK